MVPCLARHSPARDPATRLESALTPTDSRPPPLPRAFGPYRVLDRIGDGALGPVYRASAADADHADHDQHADQADQVVAVKAFDLDLEPDRIERFVEALRHVVEAGLSHPAIVPPIDAGLHAGRPFLVYEHVTADAIQAVLPRARPAPLRTVVAWVAALAAAVDAAHERGVVHGALHLADLLVVGDRLRATGFGVASALEHAGARAPVRPPYTAPEQLAGRRWGPPADRFALAAIAGRLVTGRPLAGSGDEALVHLAGAAPAVADAAGLQQAFRNGLAEDPGLRAAAAAAFGTAFARAVGGRPAGADAPAPDPDAPVGGHPFAAPDDRDPDGATDRDRTAAIGWADGIEARRHSSAHSDDDPAAGPPRRRPDDDAAPRTPARPFTDLVAAIEAGEAAGEAPGADAAAIAPDQARAVDAAVDAPFRPGRMPAHDPADEPRRPPPVVAVGDDVEWDPLEDEPDAAAPIEAGDLDDEDDVPPPPSPVAIRTVAPVVLAVVVGGGLAYLVSVGLGTTGGLLPSRAAGPGAAESRAVGTAGAASGAAAPGRPDPAAGAAASAPAAAEDSAPGPAPVAIDDPALVPVGDPPPVVGAAAAPVAPAPAADAAAPEERAALPAGRAEAPAPDPAPGPADVDPAAGGRLLVRATPPGASVRIDGVASGVVPFTRDGLADGAYRVTVSAPGYAAVEREVTISAAAPIASVAVVLTPLADPPPSPAGRAGAPGPPSAPAAGVVAVDSRPRGAAVFVDDRPAGVTPVELPDVAAGRHQVRIELAGHLAWVTEIEVRAAERVRVGASLVREGRP